MSFRTSANRVTPANSDQSRDPTLARPAPSSYIPPGMTDNGNITSSSSQNAGTRTYLQTRRRQPSTSHANPPLGPRPLDLQGSKRLASTTMNTSSTQFNGFTTNFSDSLHNDFSFDDVKDFSFAAIDPTKTVPQDREEKDSRFSVFEEPSFNFDDFHDTIVTNNSPSLSLSHFPLPGGTGPIQIPEIPSLRDLSSFPQFDQKKIPQPSVIPAPARKVSNPGSGPLSRKGSTASSTGRTYLSKGDIVATAASNTGSASRGRRQSHFPPNAFNNSANPAPIKAPRKSIGPGTFVPPENNETEVKRQPSVTGRKPGAGSDKLGKISKPQLRGNGEGSKSPRPSKTKSILLSNHNLSKDLSTPSRTPDLQKTLSIAAQPTPGKQRSGTPGATSTPGGSKRMSLAPGHATGLGARTISPTDARRLKRMSLMPSAPPVPARRISEAPPTPQPDSLPTRPRSIVQSPALQQSKITRTPSSSSTTPDPNRKSYSSGQSLSSNTSYNSTTRNAANTVLRGTLNTSTSRLPTPKPRTEQQEEEVPPVPAIPKSYDSPASEIDQPFFSARSSGLANIDTPVDSPVAQDLAEAMALLLPQPPSMSTSRVSSRFDQPDYPDQSQAEGPSKTTERGKRNFQNLRLPPLNLLPLSTPTATKIKLLKTNDEVTIEMPSTPPAMRGTKTPSTPLTASKASFFSRSIRNQDDAQQSIRSSTSHYALRSDGNMFGAPSPSLPPLSFETESTDQRSMSPFISSSLPKNSDNFNMFMQPNFGSDLKRTGTQQKPNGPRAPSYSVSNKSDTSTPMMDKTANSTPLSNINSSLQNIQKRKSETKLADLSGNDSAAARYDNMPPPRLPASATWSNLSSKVSASPTQKTGFFRSRRKASVSEMNQPDRQDSAETSVDTLVTEPSLDSIQSSIMTHSNRSGSILTQTISTSSKSAPSPESPKEGGLDKDDLGAEDEMRKLAAKRRDLEAAARKLDSLRARAKPAKRCSPSAAIHTSNLNIFEKGEIVDFPDVYFTGTRHAKKIIGDPSSPTSNFGYDDERGDYNIVEGDHLVYRYEVIDLLGKGSFGQVVRCIDHKTGLLVAVKIIRNKKRFHQQALVEVEILQKLKEWDPQKKHNVVNFDQSFYFRAHLCISTDLLDMNLYEFIKVHDFRGFSLKLIRRFTKQMLACLVLLHGKQVIHCDLKPENILLAHPAHSDIKVIDFGSSCFENEKVYTYIQSRFYRSPEVILGMSYGMPIDMWSLGCILAELYTGYPIFPGENEQEQLACIMEIFGPPEKHLIEKSTRKKLFFDSMGKPRITVSSKGKRRRPSSKDLRSVLKCDDDAFLDFLARCLRWDPARRLTPQEALRHEFITGVKTAPLASRKIAASSINSPVKRVNTIATTSNHASTRPLPQPPSAGLRPLVMSTSMAAISPSKKAPRRQSTAVATGNGDAARKASYAVVNTSSSGANNVTRVTVQRVKPADLATAAAAASLVK